MKKTLFPLILVGVLLVISIANAGVIDTPSGSIITDEFSLKATFVNQDPYPAEPGGYVDLLFKLENWGTEEAENVVFELLPEYPFSLDPGVNATRELGTIKGLQMDEKAFLLKYKVRVDKDVVEGENEIKIKYTYDTGAVSSTRTFNIAISNPRTDFDVVVQDSTAASTTLAIANIGANTAYSVIVRIPEQEDFKVTGVSANVMGNLDAGDYTLVGFQITPTSEEKNLFVEVSYTDMLGIRRTIQKEVMLDMTKINEEGTGPTQGDKSRIPGGMFVGTGGSSGLTYIGIGIVGIIIVVVFFKLKKRKKK